MIIKERRARILEVIKERKYCTINYLSQTLCVAPITIRRDLSAMEQSGLITCCFGGATVPDYENREIPLVESWPNKKAKNALQIRNKKHRNLRLLSQITVFFNYFKNLTATRALKNKAAYSQKNKINYSIEDKYAAFRKYNKLFLFRTDPEAHRHHPVGESIEKCLLRRIAEGIFLLGYRIIKFVLLRINEIGL